MRVKVRIKKKGEPRWKSPDVERVPESMLQTILSDDPDLIPFDDERRPVVLVDEFPVRFGSADLVGVGASGSITIVECKKKDNRDMRGRSVVGQLFAYAAALWEMSYEEFDARWQATERPPLMDDARWAKRKRPPLAESVADAASVRGLHYDPDAFRASVTENLRTGKSTLIVAVDEITLELQRVIEYLSAHTAAEVDVIALELGYATLGDVEVLVPLQFGLEMAERKASSTRPSRRWDEESFSAALRTTKGEWAPLIVADLLTWASQVMKLEVWYGAGPTLGTVYMGLADANARRRPLVGCWTSGNVDVYFNQLAFLPPFDGHDARVEVLQRLDKVDGVERAERQADIWPSVKLENLAKAGALESFKALVDDVVDRVREA